MANLIIDNEIKRILPNLILGVVEADVKYIKNNENLWKEFNFLIKNIREQHTVSSIKEIPQIHSTREAYKKLGKEPSRYRPSAEALLRRIIQGKNPYQISNIVDTINFVSVKTGYSIGGYDATKIQGQIIFRKGGGEEYNAIGRGQLNIENLPVFYDEKGPFGSPTSDSVRTMINPETQKVLMIVMNFGGHKNFENDIDFFDETLQKFCFAENIKKKKISN